MSTTIDSVRAKYPQYKDMSDDALTESIGDKFPVYLQQDQQFKADYDRVKSGKSVKPAEAAAAPAAGAQDDASAVEGFNAAAKQYNEAAGKLSAMAQQMGGMAERFQTQAQPFMEALQEYGPSLPNKIEQQPTETEAQTKARYEQGAKDSNAKLQAAAMEKKRASWGWGGLKPNVGEGQGRVEPESVDDYGKLYGALRRYQTNQMGAEERAEFERVHPAVIKQGLKMPYPATKAVLRGLLGTIPEKVEKGLATFLHQAFPDPQVTHEYIKRLKAGDNPREAANHYNAEIIEGIKRDPIYQAGEQTKNFWFSAIPATAKEQSQFSFKVGDTVTSFVPYAASGPYAPAVIGWESFSQHLVGDYDQAVQQGANPDEAAGQAMRTAIASGGIQGAVFAVLPPVLRKAGDKYLIEKFGQGAMSRLIADRVAQVGEGAALGAAQTLGEGVATGQMPEAKEVLASMAGMAAFQGVTPRGPTAKEAAAIQAAQELKSAAAKTAKVAPATAAAIKSQATQPPPTPKPSLPKVDLKLEGEAGKQAAAAPAAPAAPAAAAAAAPKPQPRKIDTTKPVITAAAYQDSKGQWHQGQHHLGVVADVEGQPGIAKYTARNSRNNGNFGFVVRNPDGSTRVVSREEAKPIAQASGQFIEGVDDSGPLHSDMVASPEDPTKALHQVQQPVAKFESVTNVTRDSVLTDKVKEKLTELGYPEAEINKLERDEAANIIAEDRRYTGEASPAKAEAETLSPEDKDLMDRYWGGDNTLDEAQLARAEELAQEWGPDGTRKTAEQRQADARAADAEAESHGTVSAEEYAEIERLMSDTAAESGAKTVPVEEFEGESKDMPFAGFMARPNSRGQIEFKPKLVARQLAQMPPERRKAFAKSFIAEESNHLAVINSVGHEAAAKFWNSLTAAERALHFRRYTGEWSQEALEAKHPGVKFTDAQLGHEAINSFLMRAAKMPLREFVEASGRERWTVKMLDELANLIYQIRSKLTKAGRYQRDMLDDVLTKIAAAKRDRELNPSAIDLVDMSPDRLASWKKNAQYDAALMQKMADTVRPEDLPALVKARDDLRAEVEASIKAATPETIAAAWEANAAKSLKAQTLNEMVEHAPKANAEAAPAPSTDAATDPVAQAVKAKADMPAAFQKQVDEVVNNPANWQKTSELTDDLRDRMWPVAKGVLEFQRGGESLPGQPTNTDVHDMLDLFARTSEDSATWRALPPETQAALKEWFRQMEGTGEGRGDRLRSQIAMHEQLASLYDQQGYEQQAAAERQWAESNQRWLQQLQSQSFPAAFQKSFEDLSGDPNERRAMYVLNSMRGKSVTAIANELNTTPEAVSKALETLRMRGDAVTYKGRPSYGEPDEFLWMRTTPPPTREAKPKQSPGQQSMFGAMPRRGSEAEAEARRQGPDVEVEVPTEQQIKEGLPTPDQVAEVMGQFYPAATPNDIQALAKSILFEDRLPNRERKTAATEAERLREAQWLAKQGKTPKNVKVKQESLPTEGEPEGWYSLSKFLPEMPTFQDFLEAARKKWGPMVQPGQLMELWNDEVAKLAYAKGEELARLRKVMRLEHNFGTHTVVDPRPEDLPKDAKLDVPHPVAADQPQQPTSVPVKKETMVEKLRRMLDFKRKALGRNEAKSLEQFKLEGEAGAKNKPQGDVVGTRQEGRATLVQRDVPREEAGADLSQVESEAAQRRRHGDVAAQRYRGNLVNAIMNKLRVNTPYGKGVTKPLNRKSVSLDDVGWHSGLGAWEEITSIDLDVRNREKLGEKLTTGARVSDKSGGKTNRVPVSVTKRVVFILDTRNNTVHAVSTFNDGRRGAVLVDPRSPSKVKPNVPLANVLADKRLRPLYVMTLDEPVQDFHQVWNGLDEKGQPLTNKRGKPMLGKDGKPYDGLAAFNTLMAKPANKYAQAVKGQLLDYAHALGLSGNASPRNMREAKSMAKQQFGEFGPGRENEGGIEAAPVGTRPEDFFSDDEPAEQTQLADPSVADAEGRFGSQVEHGAGGSVMGPGAGQARGEMLNEEGAFHRGERTPLTNEEARSVLDHIMDEVGSLDGPEDVRAIIQDMRDAPGSRNWRLISGLQKMYAYMLEAERVHVEDLRAQGVKDAVERSPKQVFDLLPEYIYRVWKHAKDGEDFVKRMTYYDGLRFLDQKPEVEPVSRPVKTGARELSYYKRGEVKPSKAFRNPQREVAPLPINPSQPYRIPPGQPGALPTQPTEMLSPREQRSLSRRELYAQLRKEATGDPAADKRKLSAAVQRMKDYKALGQRVTGRGTLPQMRLPGGGAYKSAETGSPTAEKPAGKQPDLFYQKGGYQGLQEGQRTEVPTGTQPSLFNNPKGSSAADLNLPKSQPKPRQVGLFESPGAFQKKSSSLTDLERDMPAAFEKLKGHKLYKSAAAKADESLDYFEKVRDAAKGWVERRGVKGDIYRLGDGADNAADGYAVLEANSIRLASMPDIDPKLATERKSALHNPAGHFGDMVKRWKENRSAEAFGQLIRTSAKAVLAVRQASHEELSKLKPAEKEEFKGMIKEVNAATDADRRVKKALADASKKLFGSALSPEDLIREAKKDKDYKRIRKEVYKEHHDELVPKTLRSIYHDALRDPEVKKAMEEHPYEPELVEEVLRQKVNANLPVDQSMFDPLKKLAETGIQKATDMLKSKQASDRLIARKWLKAATDLRDEVAFAKEHFNDPEMVAALGAYQTAMERHRKWMNANGFTIAERKFMVPGRYAGEVWNGDSLHFAGRTIGSRYYLPKRFKNYYEAIAAGPYFAADGSVSVGKKRKGPFIPVNRDIADLAQHTIMHGTRSVNRTDWMSGFKKVKDPHTGKPLVIDAVQVDRNKAELDEAGEEQVVKRKVWASPDPTYELVEIGNYGRPMAVHTDYAGAFREVLADSPVANWHVKGVPVGQIALNVSAGLKHGVLLIFDTFHAGRLFQYGFAGSGKSWLTFSMKESDWRNGLSALTYKPEDLDKAVRVGAISPHAAEWAKANIEYRVGNAVRQKRRGDIAHMMVARGLNATKIADTLHRDAVQKIPLIGEAWHNVLKGPNKIIFDKITPGLIIESAVRNYERIMKSHPNLSSDQVMRDVITDTNAMFGNMGRQGVFSNPMFRDLAQIFLLAPMWREGLFQKDLRTLSRVGVGLPMAAARTGLEKLGGETGKRMAQSKLLSYRRDLPVTGSLGRGVIRGMAAYFVLAQVANLITRQKFTWQNPEEGHKLDAIIPIGDAEVALPTMSVFGEILHDIVRLNHRDGDMGEAMGDLSMNALGPIGQASRILTTGTTPDKRKIHGLGNRLASAAGTFLTTPISLGAWMRSGAHALAPNTISPTRPTENWQRALGAVGMKVSKVESPQAQMLKLGRDFMRENKYQVDTGWEQVQTDDPSYSTLRTALRNHDLPAAQEAYNHLKLRNGKEPEAVAQNVAKVIKNMRNWSRAPFTGSTKTEGEFYQSLSPDQQAIYDRAQLERQELFTRFTDEFMPKQKD